MSPLTGLLLGLIQGLTEFLPVSPSGHLVLVEYLLHVPPAPVAFMVLLHLATLLAAVIALRRELGRILAFLASSAGIRWVSLRSDDLREGGRLFIALVIGTIPAAVAAIFFKPQIEAYFASPRFVGFALLFTGLVLLSTRMAPRGGRPIDPGSALVVGLAQAIGLLPGVSRSGMTLAAGLFAGVGRERVARFSFLLSLPAIAGASILELRHGVTLVGIPPVTLVSGIVAALVSGYLAMQLLLRVVVSGKLTIFAVYCLALGLAALFLLPATP